jgi:hypothetical protein
VVRDRPDPAQSRVPWLTLILIGIIRYPNPWVRQKSNVAFESATTMDLGAGGSSVGLVWEGGWEFLSYITFLELSCRKAFSRKSELSVLDRLWALTAPSEPKSRYGSFCPSASGPVLIL